MIGHWYRHEQSGDVYIVTWVEGDKVMGAMFDRHGRPDIVFKNTRVADFSQYTCLGKECPFDR